MFLVSFERSQFLFEILLTKLTSMSEKNQWTRERCFYIEHFSDLYFQFDWKGLILSVNIPLLLSV